MNLQHSKSRNRLHSDRVDMLLLIQMNNIQFRDQPVPTISEEALICWKKKKKRCMERILQREWIQFYYSPPQQPVPAVSYDMHFPQKTSTSLRGPVAHTLLPVHNLRQLSTFRLLPRPREFRKTTSTI